MKSRTRAAFLVLGTACFVAMASGLVLHFHLAHLDEPAEHDSDHCSLCQQLLVCRKDYTAGPEPTGVELGPVGRLATVQPVTPAHQTLPDNYKPRAPPV